MHLHVQLNELSWDEQTCGTSILVKTQSITSIPGFCPPCPFQSAPCTPLIRVTTTLTSNTTDHVCLFFIHVLPVNHTVCVFWGYLSLLTNTGFILADVWYTPCCSVAQSCATLCDPMDRSTPGFPVLHCLPEFAQTHVRGVNDVIQPSHPLLSPSLVTFNLSHHDGLFQWVSSLHQVAKVLKLQLQHQHQFFQWIFRVDFL